MAVMAAPAVMVLLIADLEHPKKPGCCVVESFLEMQIQMQSLLNYNEIDTN